MTSRFPSKDELRSLRPQLLSALFAAIFGLALFAVAMTFHGQASARLLAAKNDDMNLRQRIDRFATEEAELRKEMQQYRDLVSRGILGPAQRMKWIEGIHEIRRRRHLRALHYEFAPQQDLALPVPIPATKPFQFVTTPVQLTLLAVHEGEVIGLLDDLGERIPAYVRPRRCLLERKRSEKPGASSALQMDCQMDWITITHTP